MSYGCSQIGLGFDGWPWVGTFLTGTYLTIDVETHGKTFSNMIFHVAPNPFERNIMGTLRYKIVSVTLAYVHLYVQASAVFQIPHHPTTEA